MKYVLLVTGCIMFGLGIWELAVILIVIVLFFWRKRLPELGASLGSTVKELKKASGEPAAGQRDQGDPEKNMLTGQLPPVLKTVGRIKHKSDKMRRIARMIGLFK